MYGMRPTRTSSAASARRLVVEGAEGVVERVALDGNASGAANEREQLVERQSLRRVRAGLVIDLLAHDGALEIVHAQAQARSATAPA